ncbi:MAG: ABC transporter ATP-binding protein [Clostridia bacterium]|nr:ABC transporter ATP-binding protein [Clostridia bacterium]
MNIEVKDLTIRYGNRTVLDHINHIFEERKIHVILGPNGCGKTTLVNYLVNNAEQRDKLTYVQQETVGELDMTAGDVVKLGRYHKKGFYQVFTNEDMIKVNEAVSMMDAEDVINQNYDTLSGGEKQRIQIARAIAKDYDWLICDEPTANLDIKHQVGFAGIVKKLKAQGKSVIVIIHDINLALNIADEVLMMKEGRILYSGKASDVICEKNLKDVFETDFIRIENTDTKTNNFIYNV